MPEEMPCPARCDAATRATDRLAGLQSSDGSWEGEVVWCPAITAQVVIMRAIMDRGETPPQRKMILRHFEVTRRPDGGWGLHPQSHSYRFVTTMVYVAARLLGEAADSPMLAPAREFLARHPGGPFSLPQWGKIWLSFIGLYEGAGLNPCPPELFVLPRWLAISPMRFYCHTRHIYLAMACLVGSGFRVDLGAITAQLKAELYVPAERSLDPARRRHSLADTDAYVRPSLPLRLAFDVAYHFGAIWAHLPGATALRRHALDRCRALIRYEQRATSYQGLSPVSGILNTLALYSHEPTAADTLKSLKGVESWRWQDEEAGARYAGARSTTWDTSFVVQALLSGGEGTVSVHRNTLRRAYHRLVDMQVMRELDDGDSHGRDPVAGGWCFGDGVHRWPVSDCAAEAVVALLGCHAVPGLISPEEQISTERLRQAAEFILARQNADGGFSTYERRRGGRLLETFNPSEMFGQCMTEQSYVECTASCLRALARLRQANPPADRARLDRATDRGVALLLARQQVDGAWRGFWGINFIYGTYFAVAALRDVGLSMEHPALRRASGWLQRVQRPDGGWGESFAGCLSGRYVESPQSLVISTAWAVLALLAVEPRSSAATIKGIQWLRARQQADGDWPRDSVNGVFFGTAMLDYRLYNTYFPAKALAMFEARGHATH